jgi:hypothetical protein
LAYFQVPTECGGVCELLSFVKLLPNGYLVLKIYIYTFGLDVFLSSNFAEILAEVLRREKTTNFAEI